MSAAPLADRAPAPKRAIASSSTYREIYREHHRFVWRCLLRLGVPEASTEDALQEVFVTAFRRLHTFEHRASLRAWLAGIARRVAFRHRRTRDRVERRRSALAEIPPEHPCPDEWLRKRAAATFLQTFLEELDEGKREVFVMCELEGMRGREAAAALGVNENTAYARLRAARSLFEAACHRVRSDDIARAVARVRETHEGDEPSRESARRSMGLVLAQLGPGSALAPASAGMAGSTAAAKTAIVAKLSGLGAGVKAAMVATAIGGAAIVAGPIADRVGRDGKPTTTMSPVVVAEATPSGQASAALPIVAAPASPLPPNPAPATAVATSSTVPIDRTIASPSTSARARAARKHGEGSAGARARARRVRPTGSRARSVARGARIREALPLRVSARRARARSDGSGRRGAVPHGRSNAGQVRRADLAGHDRRGAALRAEVRRARVIGHDNRDGRRPWRTMRERAATPRRAMLLIAGLGACSPAPEAVVGEAAATGSTSAEGDDTTTTAAEPSATGQESNDAGSTSGGPPSSTGAVDVSSSGEPGATTGDVACGTIVYVHFDGITLEQGLDDAPTNTTGIAELAIDLAPYEGDDEAEIVALAASRFADFDVCFTAERPTEGDYAMAIVTPTNPIGPTTFGLAPNDCGNANPNNIVFAFSERAGDTETIAMSIARSLAITFGLDGHADGGADLMSVFSATDAMLLDECLSFGNVMPQCDHDPCRGGDQNSYQELLARLGPAM